MVSDTQEIQDSQHIHDSSNEEVVNHRPDFTGNKEDHADGQLKEELTEWVDDQTLKGMPLKD